MTLDSIRNSCDVYHNHYHQYHYYIVLEGKLPGLLKPLSVFIRLEKAIVLPTLPEVDVPTRFGK